MKKYLLGALFVLGTISYAQANKVIVPVVGTGTTGDATATLGIEVTGKVFDPAELSLVVDIKSAPSASGTGFAFAMPDMFAATEAVSTTQGDFEVYLQKGTSNPIIDGALDIKLLQGGVAGATAKTTTTAGTASGITLDYSLIGGEGFAAGGTSTKHSGGVAVKATTTAATTVGTYSDTSVQLKVALTGQTK